MQAENLAPSCIFIVSPPPPPPPDPVLDDGASPPPVEVVVTGDPRLATLGEFELPPQPARTTAAARASGTATESERIEHQLLVRAGICCLERIAPARLQRGNAGCYLRATASQRLEASEIDARRVRNA
jgi:hypothetical protein